MDYQRPPGFRFVFRGMNLRSVPDALPPDKYGLAVNIRAVSDSSIQTRPGYDLQCSTVNSAITDIRAYTQLGTDNIPRYLIRNRNNGIYLDTGTLATALAGSPSLGCSMVPFRPNASPEPWMYIANQSDFQKVSAPNALDVTIAQKVGIQEPRTSCDAAPEFLRFTEIDLSSGLWANTGSAGAASNGNVSALTNTVIGPIADPINPNRYSAEVGPTDLWAVGMVIDIAAHGGLHGIIQDYIQPIDVSLGLSIAGIRYASGLTGQCTIVLSPVQSGETGFISGFKRGAIVRLDAGGPQDERCFVLSVVTSSDGTTVSFECVTTATHAVGEIVNVPRTIVVDRLSPTFAGDTIGVNMVKSTVNGTGELSQTLASSPFRNAWGTSGFPPGSQGPQQDDYLHITFQVDSPSLLTSVKIIFNVGPSSPDYISNTFYYLLAGAGLTAASKSGALWEVMIPLTALTDAGGGANLSAVNGVQIQWVTTGSMVCAFGGITISGGNPPDVGDVGARYRYRVVPRSALTGAVGNPNPDMRYGVSPRRQAVTVTLPDVSYDSQIDTFDIYRFGGSVTSFRYVGSTPSSNTQFVDNVFDDSALAGKVLETDNFEPWPSVDVPFIQPPGAVANIVGTFITLTLLNPSDFPATIDRWLPGTLIGTGAFTLRTRPTQIDANNYLFETVEEVGLGATFGAFNVNEPDVARQILPFVWGPDPNGVIFAVGDPLRPGFIYYCKPFNPDSAPDTNNLELTPPSEPLLGGELRGGLSYVYSSMRWWQLYPSFSGTNPYTPIEAPVGKPPTTPFGSTTDGFSIYFWSKDGICATDGGPAVSLTDADLYPLFPHDGVPGEDITRNGFVIAAPNYKFIAAFRLCKVGVYLYADYLDSAGFGHTLVCDLRTNGWSVERYNDQVLVHYAPEQTEGTLATGSPQEFPLVLMGDFTGRVFHQNNASNDLGQPISCKVATFEWDGDDKRAPVMWGDAYVDVSPQDVLNVTPVSLQSSAALPTVILQSVNRQFVTVSLGGQQLLKFLGLLIEWVDSAVDAAKTKLYIWQLSLLPQPEVTQDRIEDWDAAGIQGAKYFRGFVLTADTFDGVKLLGVANGDTLTIAQTFQITHNGEQEIGYAFGAPFVAHLVRLFPQDVVPWRKFAVRWICEPWPELTTELSAWMDLGTRGAKYFRGGSVCIDTNGAPVQLSITSSDAPGNTTILGTFTTTAAQKTEIAFALSNPFSPVVGHEFQFSVSAPCRVWWQEAVFHFDPYPEVTPEWTPVMELSGPDDKYVRAVRITADSLSFPAGALPVRFQVLVNGVAGPPDIVTQPFIGKTVQSFAFTPPFIGHTIQLVPNVPVRIFLDQCKWDFEVYPELIPEYTPIMEYGGPDNKYFRGIRLTCDSAGVPVLFQVLFDGGQFGPVIGPLTFNAKQTIPWAFTPPFIAHNVQIYPIGTNCRIWTELSMWDADPYPELIPEQTSILNLGGPDAKYIQGVKITGDTQGAAVQLQIMYDGGLTGPLLEPRVWQGKSVQVFSFPPFVAHSVYIVPQGAIRIWVDESEWVFEPTPELAVQWGPTQWTAHGMVGYHHIGRIEAAYAAVIDVTLTITSFDGTSPQIITLPATGGVYQKILITPTFNKGQLYQYFAHSLGTFQIWLNDWKVYVGSWGRTDPYTLYLNLGGQYGDKARI